MSTMKKMLLFVAMGLLSTAAFAQDEGFSIGPKFAPMIDVDIDNGGDDDGDAFGVNLGYAFGNGWSAELDLLTGDLDDSNADVDSMGIYGVYRSSGEGYFLGKIGFAEGEVESFDDDGLSYGFGGGYRFSDTFSLEGEYTIFDFDESEATVVAVTARFHF